MAQLYKVISASSASELEDAMNLADADGYFVSGQVDCAITTDSLNVITELYTALMYKQNS